MKNILLIEDDKTLSHGIAIALQRETVSLIPCYDLASARSRLSAAVFDLLILDVNLPDGSGLDFLRTVKQSYDTPVILLTANDLETDIVSGLELGADDYITKPFSLAVLRARVNTQLRRQTQSDTKRFVHGSLCFCFDRMEFFKADIPVELSKTEQRLLRLLVENKGIILERGVLIDRIWTDGAEYVDENALSVAIKRLRDKLEDNPAKPKYIKTIYGIGYTWVVN